MKRIGRRLASSAAEVQLCLNDRQSAILTIAACAEGVLDDWGEVKGMDFSESVPAEEVEAIVAFMRADSVAASLALSSLGSHEADKHEHRPELQNRDKAS